MSEDEERETKEGGMGFGCWRRPHRDSSQSLHGFASSVKLCKVLRLKSPKREKRGRHFTVGRLGEDRIGQGLMHE